LGLLSDSVTVRSTYASSAGKQHSCGDRAAGVPGRSRRCGCTIFGQRSSRTVGLGDLSSAEDEPTEDELESVDCDADAESEQLVAA
jgi:hypothetical protein